MISPVVHECDGAAELHGDVGHLGGRVGHVAVALQEVEDRLAKNLERQAHVAVVAEGKWIRIMLISDHEIQPNLLKKVLQK